MNIHRVLPAMNECSFATTVVRLTGSAPRGSGGGSASCGDIASQADEYSTLDCGQLRRA
jgi:hypothetical protein